MNISTKLCRELAEAIIDLQNPNKISVPSVPLTEDQLKYVTEQSKKSVYGHSKHGYLLPKRIISDIYQPCWNCYEESILNYPDPKLSNEAFCFNCKQEYIIERI
jgi:hypothetical protein